MLCPEFRELIGAWQQLLFMEIKMNDSNRNQENGVPAAHALNTSLCLSCQASGLAVFLGSLYPLPSSCACPHLRTSGRICIFPWVRAPQRMQCPQRLSGWWGAVSAMDTEKVLLTSPYRSHRRCPGEATLVEGFVCLTFILCGGLSSLPFYC